MTDSDINLLAVTRGTVTAPAGCGKTHMIAQTLKQHNGAKPILILTHTNAGVAALRARLDKAGVAANSYRLATIDGWAMRLVGLFPKRAEIDMSVLKLANPKKDYPRIREATWRLLEAGHINDLLKASYAHLIVDEYQDCSVPQHAIVYYMAAALPACVLGDPMQAIFGFQGNELADWENMVCKHFPLVRELQTPWRWRNAGTEGFGHWLLDVRRKLVAGEPIDLTSAPVEVCWVHLDGTDDRARQLRAACTKAPGREGAVLIIGRSSSPASQHVIASQTPGAVTVENVDLKDLAHFALDLDFQSADALEKIVNFAASVMTNVGPTEIIRRVGVLERGAERKDPSEVERAALRFQAERSPKAAANLLAEISRQGGTRTHRQAVLRTCLKALQSCDGSANHSFYEAAIRAREQNRLLGRPLPGRAVGSTLLLKGLEAEAAVILDAADHDARNLYVAMTRGSKKLVICSREASIVRQGVLRPSLQPATC
jgi:hypothetical protein